MSIAVPPEGSDRACLHLAPYSNSNAYGRMYAAVPSFRRLIIHGESASPRPHAVDVDMENCHLVMISRVLKRAYPSGENVDPMYIAAFSTFAFT